MLPDWRDFLFPGWAAHQDHSFGSLPQGRCGRSDDVPICFRGEYIVFSGELESFLYEKAITPCYQFHLDLAISEVGTFFNQTAILQN